MNDTITRWLEAIPNPEIRRAVRVPLEDIGDRLSSQLNVSGALAIHGAASALAKNGSVCYGFAKGVLFKIAANTDMAALSGSVTNAKFNVYAFFIDSAGSLTSAMGTEGATLGAVAFPKIARGQALIGFVIVNPTGTGPFVGGTTALDDATVAPNAVYVNTVGPVDPSILIG